MINLVQLRVHLKKSKELTLISLDIVISFLDNIFEFSRRSCTEPTSSSWAVLKVMMHKQTGSIDGIVPSVRGWWLIKKVQELVLDFLWNWWTEIFLTVFVLFRSIDHAKNLCYLVRSLILAILLERIFTCCRDFWQQQVVVWYFSNCILRYPIEPFCGESLQQLRSQWSLEDQLVQIRIQERNLRNHLGLITFHNFFRFLSRIR